MTIHESAIIIGGGVAGCATAIALSMAGIDCSVHEARDVASDGVGAFLTLAVNGITTLRTLGLDVADIPGIDTPTLAMSLGDGTRLTAFPLGPVLADGTTMRTIKRADLYRVLRERVESLGVPVHYGHRLESVETANISHVTARFADGSAADGTLLIGADGLHSRVRGIIDAAAPQPHYLGILNAGGYAAIDVATEPGVMQMIFGRDTFFSYLPDGDGQVWWFANPPQAREPARGEPEQDPESWRATMLELVDRDETPAAAIIEATPELFEPWPTYDLPGVKSWSRDRMIVIGDAAHAASPSSGQGASMAIEDAAVIALALRDEPTIELAFAAYEAARRDRVRRVIRMGRRNGSGKAPGAIGRVIRDSMMKVIFARQAKPRAMTWPFVYPIDWAKGLESLTD